MATVTRENIGLLTDKLTVTLNKQDYFNKFEQSLKRYAKTANIPGFRKGMVPTGMVKKMYGQSVFTEEVFKTLESEINSYLSKEQLEIFAQPLPLDNDSKALDMNNPTDYTFAFEIGLKPSFEVNTSSLKVTKYKVTITDKMIEEEVERLQSRHGKMTEPATIASEDNLLNVTFTEVDADGNVVEGGINKANSLLVKYFTAAYQKQLMGKKKDDVLDINIAAAFEDKERAWVMGDLGLNQQEAGSADKNFKLTITKIGLVEKAPIDETLFSAVYPNKEIKTEADFRNEIKAELEAYFDQQSKNQMNDQIYHALLDNVQIDLPEGFLKRWLQTGREKPKTVEEAEQEYPSFANQLKWTLITNQLAQHNKIEVTPDDIKAFAKAQLFSYMGGQLGALGDNERWIEDYTNRMMQDKKYVEDSYHRISTEKLFAVLATQVQTTEEAISAEDFAEKLHHHHH